MKTIKVAIADDHKIIREGITSLFEDDAEIEISRSYSGGHELLKGMETERYDVILLDMHMPEMNGTAIAKEIIKRYPDTKILVHTMSEVIEEIEQIVRAGVHGYILKTAGYEELAVAIKVIAFGSSYYSATVMNSFIKSCITEAEQPLNNLNAEEKKILRLLCQEDYQLHEIAVKMGMTNEELNMAINRIKKILKVKTDIGLGKFCMKNIENLTGKP